MTEERQGEELKSLIEVILEDERTRKGAEPEKPSEEWLNRFTHLWPLICEWLNRFVKLWPLIYEALSTPERLEIIRILLQAKKKKVWFSELQSQLPASFYEDPADLQYHLDRLILAHLIERTTDLADPRAAKDPHFAAYSLTHLGIAVLRAIRMIFEELKPPQPNSQLFVFEL